MAVPKLKPNMGETMAATAIQANEDMGKLILRVTVGALIVFHGLALATGDAGIPNRLVAWGLPAQLMWLGFIAEFFGGLMMILGVYSRLGGLLVGGFMCMGLFFADFGLMGLENHLFLVGNEPGGNYWDT